MKHLSQLLTIATLTCLVAACGGNDTNTPKAQETQPTQNSQNTAQAPAAPIVASNTTVADTAHKPTASEPEEKEDRNINPAVQPLSIAEGKVRYETTCKICHDQGLLDAPKLSDKANWAKRLEQGMDTLYLHSAKGFNKMPAQATADVSEAEVYAAVDYMVSQVK